MRPSIKFDPLIKINRQKDVNKILNIGFFKKLSKKTSFEFTICKSNKITENKTNVSCNKNLFLGEIKIFRSENKPIEKIKSNISVKNMLLKLTSIIGKSKKIPPDKGIFF